jgi:hypothetical protein
MEKLLAEHKNKTKAESGSEKTLAQYQSKKARVFFSLWRKNP